MSADEAWKVLDSDGSGALDEDEAGLLQGASNVSDQVNEVIAALKDKKVTREEFDELVAKNPNLPELVLEWAAMNNFADNTNVIEEKN